MLFVHMTVELNFIGYMMTPEQTPLTDEGREMQFWEKLVSGSGVYERLISRPVF